MTTVGPFEIHELLGAGGMGRVYRARHVELGVDVALKALAPNLLNPEARDALRAEVEAMARLDHPHIARVFEQGTADGGPLGRGAPWFAMELLRSDLQREASSIQRWAHLTPSIHQLLDALGHAHARGVVHRDLKPSNVLIGRADDQRPGLKLVDFGIAALRPESLQRVGTPSAMAPEQWSVGLAEVGPWSDVYALGALVWRLVTGERPTGRAEQAQILLRQRRADFQPFLPRYPVPEGLEEWLRTAMAFDPADRFACCADARHALEACGALTVGQASGHGAPLPALRDESSDVTTPFPLPAHGREPRVRPRRDAPPVAPVPAGWREPLPDPASLHLAGVGRSLLAWREPPLVGREEQRDQLWATVRGSLQQRGLSRITLTGSPGVGASALGRWLIRRLAQASGSLAVSVERGGIQELVDLLLQPLGQRGDGAGRRSGLVRWGADFRLARNAIAALDAPLEPEHAAGAALDLIRALARRRPVALFLADDDPAVTALARRADELDGGVAVVTRASVAPPGWTALHVPPLPRPEASLLLDHLLPLEPGLHGELLARWGERPGALRQALLSIADRLRPGQRGFGLDGPLPEAASDALASVADLGADALDLLEVAAAGGSSIVRAIWVRAAQVPPRRVDDLSDTLIRRGAASSTPAGLVLSPDLTAALAARAEASGRSPAHHRATARALAHLRGDPVLVGRSWLRAGEPERAAAHWLEHWRRIVREHGATMASSIAAEAVTALRGVQPEREQLHGHARALALEIRQEIETIDPDEPVSLEAWALERCWYDTAAHAVRLIARAITTDQPAVHALYDRVDRGWLSRCSSTYQARILVAWYLRLERFEDPRRDEILERARAAVREAIAQAADADSAALMEHLGSSMERARLTRDGSPEQLLDVARRCVERSRHLAAAPLCLDLVELGHALAKVGRRDDADRAFDEAARTARWLRLHRSEAWATGNRAGLAALEGRWDRAAELAQRALVGNSHPYLRAVLQLFCAVQAANAGRVDEVHELLLHAEPALQKVWPADEEVKVALAQIATACAVIAPDVAARATRMAQPRA